MVLTFRQSGYLAAITAVMLGQPVSGWSQTAMGSGRYDHAPLDGTTLAFIYDKMSNISPDFRPYAQHSAAYTNASVFGRDKVFADEMASLQKRFAALDVHGTYVLRLNVPLQQYDPQAQAYGVGFGESSYIPLTDPVTYQRYGVQFTNRDAIEKIPMAPGAAEAYAHRFDLPISGSYVGSATLQLAFRMETVPPPVGSDETMLDATILAARLYTTDGRLMHDFAVAPSPASSQPGSNELKAADIEGLRLSMPLAAAISAGKSGWTQQLGSLDEGAFLFFNGLEQRTPPRPVVAGMPVPFAGQWAVCAGQQSGRQDPDERGEGIGPPAFQDCIAIIETKGDITRISSEQHLPSIDLTALKARLDAKYGTPVQVANEGSDRIWVGRDPADRNGRELRIEAEINMLPTPKVLTVTSTFYQRPGTKAPPASPQSTPKL